MSAFKQDGYPTNHIFLNSSDFDKGVVLKPGGSNFYGAYIDDEFDNWSQTSNPDVRAFLKYTAGQPDNQSQNVQFGWFYTMWVYTAAKHIGFAKFNAQTLVHFLRTANGVPIPMSRTYLNPGVPGYPAVHQPYDEFFQDVNGKFVVQTKAKGTVNGWIDGF